MPGCLMYCHKFHQQSVAGGFSLRKGDVILQTETRIPKHDLGDAYCYCRLMLINPPVSEGFPIDE